MVNDNTQAQEPYYNAFGFNRAQFLEYSSFGNDFNKRHQTLTREDKKFLKSGTISETQRQEKFEKRQHALRVLGNKKTLAPYCEVMKHRNPKILNCFKNADPEILATLLHAINISCAIDKKKEALLVLSMDVCIDKRTLDRTIKNAKDSGHRQNYNAVIHHSVTEAEREHILDRALIAILRHYPKSLTPEQQEAITERELYYAEQQPSIGSRKSYYESLEYDTERALNQYQHNTAEINQRIADKKEGNKDISTEEIYIYDMAQKIMSNPAYESVYYFVLEHANKETANSLKHATPQIIEGFVNALYASLILWEKSRTDPALSESVNNAMIEAEIQNTKDIALDKKYQYLKTNLLDLNSFWFENLLSKFAVLHTSFVSLYHNPMSGLDEEQRNAMEKSVAFHAEIDRSHHITEQFSSHYHRLGLIKDEKDIYKIFKHEAHFTEEQRMFQLSKKHFIRVLHKMQACAKKSGNRVDCNLGFYNRSSQHQNDLMESYSATDLLKYIMIYPFLLDHTNSMVRKKCRYMGMLELAKLQDIVIADSRYEDSKIGISYDKYKRIGTMHNLLKNASRVERDKILLDAFNELQGITEYTESDESQSVEPIGYYAMRDIEECNKEFRAEEQSKESKNETKANGREWYIDEYSETSISTESTASKVVPATHLEMCGRFSMNGKTDNLLQCRGAFVQ